MVGWTIFGLVLGMAALTFHEERGRQILIGMLFAVVCVITIALTDSLSWGILLGGISALALAVKIYLNQMAREFEAKERERYDREAELRRRDWETRFDSYSD